jgi:uncharacterized repeat protein (TIGR03803 family)
MKTKQLIDIAALSLLSTLHLQFSVALAQTNRVGVITVGYAMSGGGSGNWDYSDPSEGVEDQDQIRISIAGQVKYAVLQTQTNSIIGTLISSSAQQTVSGADQGTTWPPTQPYDYPYVTDSSFNPTNDCVLLTIATDGSGLFSGTCQGAVLGLGDTNISAQIDDGWEAIDWPCINAMQGCACAWHGEDEACRFQFAITNSAIAWSQTLATNTTVSSAGADELASWSGSAEITNLVTLKYVPDQLTVPFSANPTNGPAPLTVQFSCANMDSGGDLLTNWNWSFGDGTTSASQAPSHTYTNTNTFSVTLTATNINGSTARGIGPTNVVVALPTAQFTAWPTNGFIPLPVSFDCTNVDSGGNVLVSWSWNFGDLETSSDQNPSHIYFATKSKTFSPKLTVTNSWGMAIAATGPKIGAVYPPISFAASPTNGLIPMRVQFSAPAADLLGVAITNWQWKFGDGAASRLQNPSHTYANVGIFSPTLIATNANKTAVGGFGPNIGAGCVAVYTFIGSGVGYDPVSGSMTNSDGIHPQAGLALSGNRLYGLMSGGGSGGSGTIFAVNTDGTGFTNLYQFSAADMATYTNGDGANPVARLVLSGTTLFGAASSGGPGMLAPGTLFKIQTDGSGFASFDTLGSTNGVSPNGLALSGDTLYGTAANGGGGYNGTVFKLNIDGSSFAVIHEFSATDYDPSSGNFTNSDGACPEASLLLTGVGLCGTTSRGGIGGGGTVFRLDTDGSGFTVLHNFTNSDGSTPSAELLLSSNTLYGTTSGGGSGGDGTVFKVNTDGSGFATLYSFTASGYDLSSEGYTNSDGAQPSAGLLLFGGVLYGTTQTGGTGGAGTLFAIDTDGTGFANLYSFSAPAYNSDLNCYTNLEGANPCGGLVLGGATVYTALCNGGPAGEGALFALDLVATTPSLTIQFNGNAPVISWPSSATGFVLQQNAGLGTTNWTTSGFSVFDDGSTTSAIITPTAGNLFFRLCKP